MGKRPGVGLGEGSGQERFGGGLEVERGKVLGYGGFGFWGIFDGHGGLGVCSRGSWGFSSRNVCNHNFCVCYILKLLKHLS